MFLLISLVMLISALKIPILYISQACFFFCFRVMALLLCVSNPCGSFDMNSPTLVSFIMQKTGLVLGAVSASEPQGAVFHQDSGGQTPVFGQHRSTTERERGRRGRRGRGEEVSSVGGCSLLVLFSVLVRKNRVEWGRQDVKCW